MDERQAERDLSSGRGAAEAGREGDEMITQTEPLGDRASLRWNGWVAPGLLIVMAAVLLATFAVPSPGSWILLLRASAEAALVGGFADWFAVTALFRRPLGLPIPHTAVVPRNKDRIGEGLAAFFERNFLTREIISAALRSVDPARKLAGWLAAPENANLLADQLLHLAPHVINTADDQAIRAFFAKSVHEQLHRDFGPLLGRAVGELAASGFHGALVDDALRACRAFLESREERFEELVAERHRGWIRKAVDRQIARAVIHSVESFIDDLLKADSSARHKLLQAIEQRAQAAIASPADAAKLEHAKIRLLEDPEVQAWLGSLWDRLRDAALHDIASPSSKTRTTLIASIHSIGETLSEDASLRERLNGLLEAAVGEVVPWREELLALIADVVESWDAQAFSERIEVAVGNDLQYIRINGTIVGAVVGCLLHLGKTALIQGF